MIFDADSAELFLASEIEWDAEPALSTAQQQFLLTAAKATDESYSIDTNMGAAIYLGLSWKLKMAIEYHEGNESKIFDHLKEVMERWAIYADSTLGAAPDALQLFELEVGQNFIEAV